MKLFIVTLAANFGGDSEFIQESDSLAQLAKIVTNMGLRVRAIEEIPPGAFADGLETLSQIPIGVAEKFRIHGPGDADIFADVATMPPAMTNVR